MMSEGKPQPRSTARDRQPKPRQSSQTPPEAGQGQRSSPPPQPPPSHESAEHYPPTEPEQREAEINQEHAQAEADAAPESESGETTEQEGEEDALSLQSRVEAVLMSVQRPIPARKIAELMADTSAKAVTQTVEALNALYEQHDRSFRIEQVAGGYQMLTLPRFNQVLGRLHKSAGEERLSPAQLETLAVVAYKQPILRTDIEAIRGVSCGEILRSLMDKHLVRIAGRADELGRPMLYGTTRTFLEVFGLGSLKDLPDADEATKR